MGRKSFKIKRKRNRVQGGEKIKFPTKKTEIRGKKNEEKIKLQRKTEIRAEKGQRRKVNLGWHRDRKENPISAPSIHVGALVGAGSLWPNFIRKHFFFKCVCLLVCINTIDNQEIF